MIPKWRSAQPPMLSSADLGAGASIADTHDRPAKRQKLESLFRFSNSQRKVEGVRLGSLLQPFRRQSLSAMRSPPARRRFMEPVLGSLPSAAQ